MIIDRNQFIEILSKEKLHGFASIEKCLRGYRYAATVCNNHVVRDTIIVGFSYGTLLQRSKEILSKITKEEWYSRVIRQYPAGWSYVNEALTDIARSIDESIEKRNTKHREIFVPRKDREGHRIHGISMYRCIKNEFCRCKKCNPDNIHAIMPGTVFISGLLIQRKIVSPASIVHERSMAPLTKVKEIIRQYLPSNKYVKYNLEPGMTFVFKFKGKILEVQDGTES